MSYPLLMRQAGYRTGFVGKFGFSMDLSRRRLYDYYERISRKPYWKTMPNGSKRHISQITGDHSIEFIRRNAGSEPFCLQVSFNAVHAEDKVKEPGGLLRGHFPYPRATAGLYSDVEIPPPKLNDPDIIRKQPEFLQESLNRKRYFWRWDTPEKYETNMRAYLRMISGVDHVIGRVLDVLEDEGVADNTIIVYSADNGFYMGERGFAGKWSHYDESLRVPLIVYDPRLPGGRWGHLPEEMALNVDLPLLMLRYAGIDVPGRYQGRELRQMVCGSADDWRSDFFCEFERDHPHIPKWEGVRGQCYKYARYFGQDPPYEFLHDLQEDPRELINVASYPDYAEVLKRMRRRCFALRDRYGGPYEPL